jgi:hypothetical protein
MISLLFFNIAMENGWIYIYRYRYRYDDMYGINWINLSIMMAVVND